VSDVHLPGAAPERRKADREVAVDRAGGAILALLCSGMTSRSAPFVPPVHANPQSGHRVVQVTTRRTAAIKLIALAALREDGGLCIRSTSAER
jgi:hypothetical protein